MGDAWHLDAAVSTSQGEHQSLWRAVDQDGATLDSLVHRRRNTQAAVCFFRRVINGQGDEPRWLITDTLRNYDAAQRAVMPTGKHSNDTDANNRADVSQHPTRQQDYHMRSVSSSKQAQQFLT